MHCPGCGHKGHFKPYQRRRDFDGRRVSIEICTVCTTLVNRTNLEEALADQTASLERQKLSSKAFYTVEPDGENLRSEVEANIGILQFLFDNAKTPVPRSLVIDLGAGRGCLAAAACRYFDQAWALEINRQTLDLTHPHFGEERLRIASWLIPLSHVHLDMVLGTD